MNKRYAVHDLLGHITPDATNAVSHAANIIGVSRHAIYGAQRRGGLSERQADDWAMRAGFHPSEIWANWFEPDESNKQQVAAPAAQRKETTVTAMPTTNYADCACSTHVGNLDAEHHAWLLSIEDRGAAGFADLTAMVASQPDLGCTKGHLHMFELQTFVATHNWTDPEAMFRLADALNFLGGVFRDVRKAEDRKLGIVA